VSWAKEGRKYDLGAVLITQQPGAISGELLSQGDNWFSFHLLSAGDLYAIKKANAHFSDDILSSLLNEPIVGQGVFWSSAGGTPYPIPLRVLSFEKMFQTRDPQYGAPSVETFASIIKAEFAEALGGEGVATTTPAPEVVEEGRGPYGGPEDDHMPPESPGIDVRETQVRKAIAALEADTGLVSQLRDHGVPWWEVQRRLANALPRVMPWEERRQLAYSIVPRAVNEVIGPEGIDWHSAKAPRPDGSAITTWILPGKGTSE
jgi:hypothetical protein